MIESEDKYLAFVDHRFSKMAEEEIMAFLSDCKLEPYGIKNSKTIDTIFLKLCIKKSQNEMFAKIRKAGLSFVDFIMYVDKVIDANDMIEYQKIRDSISEVIDNGKYRSFKIEAKNVDWKSEETAKSIEVLLGQEIEKKGYRVDFKTPEVKIYVVLLSAFTIVGHVESGTQHDDNLDLFRSINNNKIKRINRAEFKIEEAVKFFRIDLSRYRIALDIGASPGGWTHYLSMHGIRVVAVDKAFLDYKKIIGNGRILVLADEVEIPKIRKIISDEGMNEDVSVEIADGYKGNMDYNIIHIKANIEYEKKMKLLGRFGKFDLLTIDTNTAPSKSSAIANSLIGLLNSKAFVIMTIKLPKRAFSKYISIAKTELSKDYMIIQLKHLPHNRREITLYGKINTTSN